MKYCKGNSQLFLIIVVIVAAVLGAVIWKFSETFGLAPGVGARVLGLNVGTLVLWGALHRFDIAKFSDTWPIVLGMLSACWWPALDHWSEKANTLNGYLITDVPNWYAAWYAEAGMVIVIIAVGYVIRNYFSRD